METLSRLYCRSEAEDEREYCEEGPWHDLQACHHTALAIHIEVGGVAGAGVTARGRVLIGCQILDDCPQGIACMRESAKRLPLGLGHA